MVRDETDRQSIATTIRIPPAIWRLLRLYAEQRALREGGKANVSAMIAALVEAEAARRRELEAGSDVR